LTQDMLVEKQEQLTAVLPLPLEAKDDDDAKAETSSQPVDEQDDYQKPGMHLSAKQVEQVLELVAIDVSYQFNQLLPDMIQKSLQTHLQMMQQEPLKKETKK